MKKKRPIYIITMALIVCAVLFLYWAEARETTELRGLADLQQDIIYEQQVEIADRYTEIDDLYVKLQQQSNNIRYLDNEVETASEAITLLEAEIDSYDFISGWVYKPWQSKAELKDWLRSNAVSEQEYVPTTQDCDDFSDDLFFDALADNRVIGKMREPGHQFNFAIVDNDIFAIEPQTDKITKDGAVD